MHNWGVDIKELQKDEEKFAIWKLEQMVNFGTDGTKIKESDLKKYWDKIFLDPAKRNFLGLLVWGKKFLINGK